MRKIYFAFFLITFFTSESRSQENIPNASVVISPFSLFGGRLNIKWEKITSKKFTFGARYEASFMDNNLDKHIWLNPYGRFYVFSKEASGLYAEMGGFYRLRYKKSEAWTASQDYYKSAPGFRMASGFQWFAGSKRKIPIDILLGLNLDTGLKNFEDDPTRLSGTFNAIAGPLNAFFFRIQTGISF